MFQPTFAYHSPPLTLQDEEMSPLPSLINYHDSPSPSFDGSESHLPSPSLAYSGLITSPSSFPLITDGWLGMQEDYSTWMNPNSCSTYQPSELYSAPTAQTISFDQHLAVDPYTIAGTMPYYSIEPVLSVENIPQPIQAESPATDPCDSPSPATNVSDRDPTQSPETCRFSKEELKNKICPTCGKHFTRVSNLRLHLETHAPHREYAHPCQAKDCNKKFQRRKDLERHIQSVHSKTKNYSCSFCELTFSRKDTLVRHEKQACPLRGSLRARARRRRVRS